MGRGGHNDVCRGDVDRVLVDWVGDLQFMGLDSRPRTYMRRVPSVTDGMGPEVGFQYRYA